jgi:ribosomal protein S4
MRIIKNTIYKPFYKNLIRLNNNVQARLKFLFFEKKKWKDLISFENNKKKNVILFDHTIYLRPRYGFKFENKFKFYLNLRQKLKFFYGKLSDKKFKNIYYKSKNKNIVKINKFFNKNSFSILFFLESRLDVILYRTLFFDSIRSSQQAIYHGKIFVNGKKISINSYLTKKGDLIQIDYSFHKVILKNEAYYQNCRIIVPEYLEINYRTFQFFIVSDISLSKISSNFPFWLNINKLFLLNH